MTRDPIILVLGRLHAWRDRGAGYTEGIRTSGQFGLVGAGVAKAAGFTDTAWAIGIGVGLALGIEGLKLGLGWLDFRYRVYHAQQGLVSEANPVIMRQVHALEALVAQQHNGLSDPRASTVRLTEGPRA